MDRVLQPAAATNYRICSRCQKKMHAESLHKTCHACRAVDRLRREKRLLKMKKIQHMVHTNVRDQKYNATDASTNREDASTTHHDKSRKFVTGVKRKAEKSLHELEGEEQKVALKMMKTSLKKTIQRHGKKPLPILNVKSVSDYASFHKIL